MLCAQLGSRAGRKVQIEGQLAVVAETSPVRESERGVRLNSNHAQYFINMRSRLNACYRSTASM